MMSRTFVLYDSNFSYTLLLRILCKYHICFRKVYHYQISSLYLHMYFDPCPPPPLCVFHKTKKQTNLFLFLILINLFCFLGGLNCLKLFLTKFQIGTSILCPFKSLILCLYGWCVYVCVVR